MYLSWAYFILILILLDLLDEPVDNVGKTCALRFGFIVWCALAFVSAVDGFSVAVCVERL